MKKLSADLGLHTAGFPLSINLLSLWSFTCCVSASCRMLWEPSLPLFLSFFGSFFFSFSLPLRLFALCFYLLPNCSFTYLPYFCSSFLHFVDDSLVFESCAFCSMICSVVSLLLPGISLFLFLLLHPGSQPTLTYVSASDVLIYNCSIYTTKLNSLLSLLVTHLWFTERPHPLPQTLLSLYPILCSPPWQDFLGQVYCTLGEIVGSPASRLEKPLGWVFARLCSFLWLFYW